MDRLPAVYILTNRRNGTLYIGVTSNLIKRIWEHKTDAVEGFSKRYSLHSLVWYEIHETMASAIKKEKGLKKWNREWKIRLIESQNPNWNDLYEAVV